MLTRIIQPRLEEIFGEVQTRLRASGYDVAAGRRAVLTGGACQLAGTRELAQRVLNKQVRIGRPQSFSRSAGGLGRPGLFDGAGTADRRRDHAARVSEPRSGGSAPGSAAERNSSGASPPGCWVEDNAC